MMNIKPILKKLFLVFLALFLVVGAFWFSLKFALGDLSVFLPHYKALLGFDQKKSYLVVLQNNNELRPSGGFISAYGILNIKNGKIDFGLEDSYNLDSDAKLGEAPEAFQVFMRDDPKFKGWYFRDANFDVDFSRSAMKMEKLFWEQSAKKLADVGGSFDGVIAVNFEFIEDLLDIYELKVGGENLDKNNLFSMLEFEVKNIDTHNVEALKGRKDVLKELAEKLMHEIVFSPTKYKRFFAMMGEGLDQKKIQLFFKDEDIERIAAGKSWAGKFVPGDYRNFIYTNVANLGGRKSDRYIQKSHQYFVSFDDQHRARVRYSLLLEHFGSYTLNSDVYQAYARVFLPSGSEFVSSNGDFYEDRANFRSGYFEGYIKMKPGEKREIELEYLLPESINEKNFSLDLIKQPGTSDFWNVVVSYPQDSSFSSEGFLNKDNLGFWRGYLSADKHFDFEYLKDKSSPVLAWQRFSELNLIELNFSEKLSSKYYLNSANYEIRDLNYVNGESDAIVVEKVYFENNNIYLVTSGISPAEEERYSLTLRNLTDLSGNKIEPNPMTVTLIQRL